MATYIELYDLAQQDSVLRNRITVACLVAAEAIRGEAPATANHDNRMTWAKSVFAGPTEAGARMLMAVLAQNAALLKSQITGATDVQLQTAVNNAVNVFATGV